MHKKLIAVAACLALALPSQAQTWTKTGNPGNLPGSAQITFGTGALTTITGALTFVQLGTERNTIYRSNADMFGFRVTGLGLFSATTVGTPGTLYDTRLYLFNSAGRGVYMNDDDPNAIGARSTLPGMTLSPGLYYLGIAAFGATPLSGPNAPIFPDPTSADDFTGVFGPSGSGGRSPISAWNLGANDVETGSYTIRLTGAELVAVPEPSALAALGIGTVLLGSLVRRRRPKV